MHPIVEDEIVDGHVGGIFEKMTDIGGRKVGVFADGGDGQVRIGIAVFDELDDPVHRGVAVFALVERIVILVDALYYKILQLGDEGEIRSFYLLHHES